MVIFWDCVYYVNGSKNFWSSEAVQVSIIPVSCCFYTKLTTVSTFAKAYDILSRQSGKQTLLYASWSIAQPWWFSSCSGKEISTLEISWSLYSKAIVGRSANILQLLTNSILESFSRLLGAGFDSQFQSYTTSLKQRKVDCLRWLQTVLNHQLI